MRKKLKRAGLFLVSVFAIYFFAFTGPRRTYEYPVSEASPYVLPWASGVKRFVSQGNWSFTTHRGFYEYSWDFWMAVGTEILASRAGVVVDVEDSLDGFGFKANHVDVRHVDGTRAVYAHIEYGSSLVKVGDEVKQGQPVARAGMVGWTINPHLHFHVVGVDGKKTIPITFRDVPGGIPRAGNFYRSATRTD